MKIFSKITMAVLALGLTFALTSCGDDDNNDCANCDAAMYEEQGVTIELDAINVCVGDDNGAGGTYTQADIDGIIQLYEDAGSTCDN